MAKILIKKLNPKVKLPSYKTLGASGMDIMAFIQKPIYLEPNHSVLVPTGISLSIPKNLEIQVRPRSGLAINSSIGVLNTPGTIDSDYRGEIKVILFNYGKDNFEIKNNDRIAQIVLAPIEKIEFEEVNELSDTLRGKGGFGSTGK